MSFLKEVFLRSRLSDGGISRAFIEYIRVIYNRIYRFRYLSGCVLFLCWFPGQRELLSC
jgi:hypothetical protein